MTPFDGFDLAPLLQAAADDLQTTVTGEARWACAGEIELAGLTRSDRDLIHVATGERIAKEITCEIPVSFFALQIAVDRLVGPLRGGDYVSIAYVEDVVDPHLEAAGVQQPIPADGALGTAV